MTAKALLNRLILFSRINYSKELKEKKCDIIICVSDMRNSMTFQHDLELPLQMKIKNFSRQYFLIDRSTIISSSDYHSCEVTKIVPSSDGILLLLYFLKHCKKTSSCRFFYYFFKNNKAGLLFCNSWFVV